MLNKVSKESAIDDFDIELADEGLMEYKKNPKTYSIEELLDEVFEKDLSR